MRIAVISDIHGNLPALDAVLLDIEQQRADVTVNLGDILSSPLWPTETAARLMPLALPTIAGNHERQLLTLPVEKMGRTDAHTARELHPAHRAWLASLPVQLQLSEEVLCVHGAPGSDLTYFLETLTPDFAGAGKGANGVRAATISEATARAGEAMKGVAHAVILCGHTHLPRALRLLDGRLVVNPGSVGLQAYDDDHPLLHLMETGSPHARYALLDRTRAGWSVSLRAVAYDWESAAARADRNGRPEWAYALRTGFNASPRNAE